MAPARILVVEDERIIALHLSQQLTALGYEVPSAVTSGDQALRRIEEAPPDLVLMDINLKGRMDGIATAAAIPPGYHIPVIYLTAYSGDAIVDRAAATNPYGYLLKPFSERELHAMIQVTLARCRAERESRANQEFRQQTRKMEALSHLAGGLAEEVNDLLTVIHGQLEQLGTHAIREPALAEPIQDAFGEAIEKERLIQQLLDFSGRRVLAPATVSVYDLVQTAAGQLRRIAGDSVWFGTHLPADLWPVRIDPGQFARALSCLATNASEAMPNGGSLTIEAQNANLGPEAARHRHDATSPAAPPDGRTARGRYVLLSVTDTGAGMTDRVIERAFEPFFTTKPAGEGNGLGLSLVFAFIRQSGGHISIDSAPDSGTTVRLYLPAADVPVAAVSGPLDTPGTDARDPATAPDAPDAFAWTAEPDPADTAEQPATDENISITSVRSQNGHARLRHRPPLAERSDRTAPVLWHMAENAMFADVAARPGRLRYKLIVEPLPRRDGWDWAVWRPGEPEETSRHGRASSVVSAMAAAEDAARQWDEIVPG